MSRRCSPLYPRRWTRTKMRSSCSNSSSSSRLEADQTTIKAMVVNKAGSRETTTMVPHQATATSATTVDSRIGSDRQSGNLMATDDQEAIVLMQLGIEPATYVVTRITPSWTAASSMTQPSLRRRKLPSSSSAEASTTSKLKSTAPMLML